MRERTLAYLMFNLRMYMFILNASGKFSYLNIVCFSVTSRYCEPIIMFDSILYWKYLRRSVVVILYKPFVYIYPYTATDDVFFHEIQYHVLQ